MTIAPLIKYDFKTVSAYDGVHTIRDHLAKNVAIVVTDDDRAIGLLISNDLLRPHNLIIDCLRPKPMVSIQHSINEVLKLMKEANSPALPVYEGDLLVGVIYRYDITDYLIQAVEKNKSILQTIAHDLRNPISNIIGLNHLMKANITLHEKEELLSISERSCEHATEMINELLYTGKLENDGLKFAHAEFNTFLTDCLLAVKGEASKKNINLINKISTEHCYHPIDKIKLQRAIHNLLSNAIKFTPENGQVCISSKVEPEKFTIIIEDTGIGIPLIDQPVIFNKYSSARRKGTAGEHSIGLGMYITKQIVELHKAHIKFESAENQGTTFFIEFDLNQ